MKGKMDTRTQHENEPLQSHLEIFWHAKDFATAHEVPAWPWETPHVVKQWLKMPSRMTRCVYDESRLWTFPFSCIHLVSTSGQCDACIKTYRANCDWFIRVFWEWNKVLGATAVSFIKSMSSGRNNLSWFDILQSSTSSSVSRTWLLCTHKNNEYFTCHSSQTTIH